MRAASSERAPGACAAVIVIQTCSTEECRDASLERGVRDLAITLASRTVRVNIAWTTINGVRLGADSSNTRVGCTIRVTGARTSRGGLGADSGDTLVGGAVGMESTNTGSRVLVALAGGSVARAGGTVAVCRANARSDRGLDTLEVVWGSDFAVALVRQAASVGFAGRSDGLGSWGRERGGESRNSKGHSDQRKQFETHLGCLR
jgi:hypothetical protein